MRKLDAGSQTLLLAEQSAATSCSGWAGFPPAMRDGGALVGASLRQPFSHWSAGKSSEVTVDPKTMAESTQRPTTWGF